MDARREWTADAGQETAATREAWLLGQPPLDDFLDFITDRAVGGSAIARAALVHEWRAANDRYHELEESEAGIADRATWRDLDPELQPLADEVAADPRFRRAFDVLPTRFATVELAKLVLSQSHVDLGYAERLEARLGQSPTPEALFRFCLPLDRSEAPVKMRQAGARRFLFWSPSSDFRFHEAAQLAPAQIEGYDAFGAVASILGLVVGYGSNFLSVIQSDDRLLLHNGHHRAYALLALGMTHAPCIVQTVTRRDELDLVASSRVRQDPAFYFRAKRPPLLKDFLDPGIRKVVPVHPAVRMVELSFEVKELELRDFEAAG
jgi:hypothetical protein